MRAGAGGLLSLISVLGVWREGWSTLCAGRLGCHGQLEFIDGLGG